MIEVLREGEPTLDGRFIQVGAIELPEESVPLFDYDRDINEPVARPVGELTHFSRGDDNRIYCEPTVELGDRVVTLTVRIDEREYVGGEGVWVVQGVIMGGVVSESMKYPWK